ncbi:MAG: hypothetical protein IK083_09170 [Abditibacteriota bacterium]|nr:hypothetical protein [Abditibacteriota bacterium]
MNKSVVFAIMLVMAIVVGALIVYGKTGNTGTSVFGQTAIQPKASKNITAASSDAGEQTKKKVNLRKLAKTGIISDIYRNNTCIAGTSEELFPISAGRSAVFRTVCETGLDKNGSDISARKTLYIILREKGPDGLKYTDEVIKTLVKNYKEFTEGAFDFSPRIIDAEASDDGSFLRLLCGYEGEILLYNFDLDQKNWRDKESLSSAPSRMRDHWYLASEYNVGLVKQVYFLAPDIVFLSTDNGMEYASRVRLFDEELTEYHSMSPTKTVKKKHFGNMFYQGVYWNRVGDEVFLEVFWKLEKGALQDGTPVYGSWRLKDDPFLPDKKPVPAQKDWEGWHKLER